MYSVSQKELQLHIRLVPGRSFDYCERSGTTVSQLLDTLYQDGRMRYRPDEVRVWVNDQVVPGNFSIEEESFIKIQRNMDGGSQ